MKNLKINLVCLVALVATTLNGQQIINTAGGVYQNSQNSLSWSMGELAIQTLITESNILTQGFQQSLLNITAIDDPIGVDFSVIVYPNPTNDFVTVDLDVPEFSDFEYQLIGPKGDAIEKVKFTAKSMKVSFLSLTQGTYFLRIIKEKESVKSFKIFKK